MESTERAPRAMSELSEILGHEFADGELADLALTHRSAVTRGSKTYERLEFLGDRVLSLVIADMLYDAFPKEDEGALAKRLVDLVRGETLAEIGGAIGLAPHIRFSRGEEDAGGRGNPAILADVCEALIGALYRDGGMKTAEAFIRRHWAGRMHSTLEPPKDAKTSLQEWAQARGYALPAYREVARSGPDHAPSFTISVTVGDFPPGQGAGPTKRAAETEAAERLLERLDPADG